jgi:hypothetical protein
MVQLGRALQQFEFDIAAQRSEKMIGLSRHSAVVLLQEAFCLSDLTDLELDI